MDIFAHPLFLLLSGALLTGLLFPRLTRQWQDRQKELEVKTDLISDMSEATVGFLSYITAVRILRTWLPPEGAEIASSGKDTIRDQYDAAWKEMNAASHQFSVRSAIIGAKLRAYFVKDLERTWGQLSSNVINLYALEGTHDPGKRLLAQLRILAELLGQFEEAKPIPDAWANNNRDWDHVRRLLILWQQAVNERVLAERSSLRAQ